MDDMTRFLDGLAQAYNALRAADIAEGNDTPWEDVPLKSRREIATSCWRLSPYEDPNAISDLFDIYGIA